MAVVDPAPSYKLTNVRAIPLDRNSSPSPRPCGRRPIPPMCPTVTSYYGQDSLVKLRKCNRGSSSQNFLEVHTSGNFELQLQDNANWCLSQHHHPKRAKVVYPENVTRLARRIDLLEDLLNAIVQDLL